MWAREREEGGWGEEDCGQGSLSSYLWMLQTQEDPTLQSLENYPHCRVLGVTIKLIIKNQKEGKKKEPFRKKKKKKKKSNKPRAL